MTSVRSSADFYLLDFGKTLFPLKTNRILVERSAEKLRGFALKCTNPAEQASCFLPAHRVYAAKPELHLRRTVKLDPVSEFYIYDLLYRNRARFLKPKARGRAHFGYRFENGEPIPPTAAYQAFKTAIAEYRRQYAHFLSFDIAAYFNSIYHHDLSGWFIQLGVDTEDCRGFNQFLREINSGRSIDCLPQGLYPTKMVGNDFLRFVEEHHQVQSAKVIRFMDDIYLFGDDINIIQKDFIFIQQLLGERGLSVNPKKTNRQDPGHIRVNEDAEASKQRLLKRRRIIIRQDYDENDESDSIVIERKMPLSDIELAYIINLLDRDFLDEDDVELILTVMRDHADRVAGKLGYIIATFPNLAKNIYSFCSNIIDKEFIASTILAYVRTSQCVQEYQLFWFGVMLEEYLLNTSFAPNLIHSLYNHPQATVVSRAKILEIPDLRFGMPDLRTRFLRSGQSDWLAWASAVGHRRVAPATRNYQLTYFAKSSAVNALIGEIVSTWPAS